jgi:hypothetical protein
MGEGEERDAERPRLIVGLLRGARAADVAIAARKRFAEEG